MITHVTQQEHKELSGFGKLIGQTLGWVNRCSDAGRHRLHIQLCFQPLQPAHRWSRFLNSGSVANTATARPSLKIALPAWRCWDCDQQATDTPRSRMHVMDVRFSGLDLSAKRGITAL
jgi:hypothetical protein